jgi:hypothetical protein
VPLARRSGNQSHRSRSAGVELPLQTIFIVHHVWRAQDAAFQRASVDSDRDCGLGTARRTPGGARGIVETVDRLMSSLRDARVN